MNTQTLLWAGVMYLTAAFSTLARPAILQLGAEYQMSIDNMPARTYMQAGDPNPGGSFELFATSENAGGNQAFADFIWTNNTPISLSVVIADLIMTITIGEGSNKAITAVVFPATIRSNAIFLTGFAQPPLGQTNPPPGGITLKIDSVNGEPIIAQGTPSGNIRAGYAGYANGESRFGVLYGFEDVQHLTVQGTIWTTQAGEHNHSLQVGFGNFTPTPEPTTALLLLLGGGAMLGSGRRRQP